MGEQICPSKLLEGFKISLLAETSTAFFRGPGRGEAYAFCLEMDTDNPRNFRKRSSRSLVAFAAKICVGFLTGDICSIL